MITEAAPTEAEVRRMRDQVFSVPSSDSNWEATRDNWMRPDSMEWLRKKLAIDQVAKTPAESVN